MISYTINYMTSSISIKGVQKKTLSYSRQKRQIFSTTAGSVFQGLTNEESEALHPQAFHTIILILHKMTADNISLHEWERFR